MSDEWRDKTIVVTAGMWDDVLLEIAHLKKERDAILHATGVKRFDPEIYNLEKGEDREILNHYGYTDVFSEAEEKSSMMTKEKADLIYEHMIEQQKLCPPNQFFVLKTKDVLDLFGTKNKSRAIDWMEKTAKMYPGRVIRQKVKGGPNGYWIMTLSASEIKELDCIPCGTHLCNHIRT